MFTLLHRDVQGTSLSLVAMHKIMYRMFLFGHLRGKLYKEFFAIIFNFILEQRKTPRQTPLYPYFYRVCF